MSSKKKLRWLHQRSYLFCSEQQEAYFNMILFVGVLNCYRDIMFFGAAVVAIPRLLHLVALGICATSY